jgi:CDP-paratose 2-epimerase
MRYLITGGCGFLGANLARHVLQNALGELTIFDNLSRSGAERNLSWLREGGNFRFIHGDIRLAEDVESAVAASRPEVIFHLAGQVAMNTSLNDPRRDFEINALGTVNLLEAVRRNAPSAFVVYSSTNKVYGDLEYLRYAETETRYVAVDFPHGFPESLPLDFRTPYGASKGSADQYMLEYHRSFGLRTVVFRHSSMYGHRQFATIDQGWVSWFCDRAWRQARGDTSEFTIAGDGKQVRDLLHAADMTRLYFAAVDRADNIVGHSFNVGGGMENSLSLVELFSLLEELTGVALRYVRLPRRSSDQKVFVADIRTLSKMLDWAPLINKKDGVTRTLEWVRHASVE